MALRARLAMTALSSIALLFCAASGCAPKPDIVIGLAGSFSGKDYAIGVEGRNAVRLFLKDLNAKGGIKGRALRLVERDFGSDQSRIAGVDEELLREGAIVIVGYFTSAAAETALPFAEERGITLVSPTATADSLGGKDDHFFRTVMSSRADPIAIMANMDERGMLRLFSIAAAQNAPYSETYLASLRSAGRLAGELLISDTSSLPFSRIARAGADAILVIGNTIDSGTIAQSIRLAGISKPLYLSGFAATNGDEVIRYGGAAVEGAWFVHQIDVDNPALAPVQKAYLEAYGEPITLAGIETWDSLCLVQAVIEKGGTDRESFYRVIRSIREFQGSGMAISLDGFGDAKRPLFAHVIDKGKIRSLGRVE